MSPHPISLNFLSILLQKATFSPIYVQIGFVSSTTMLFNSSFTLTTMPGVSVEPTLNFSYSPFVILATLLSELLSVFVISFLSKKN